ncbi:MAG: hydrogenase maturation nickel metallochaperone HypA [Bacilli bacterium]|jgi:hydrogenase nickel incorporation protein HypA/HybF|nr:hydrogenase maturation nickel metallochaperone HypA [Bacilli bacterium]
MHEMGIAFELIDSLKRICSDEGVTKLKSVTLSLGEASMVVPRYMLDCWSAATIDTPFAKAKLKIRIVPCKGKCNRCGMLFSVKRNDRVCPHCHAVNDFVPVTGMGIEITQIETER